MEYFKGFYSDKQVEMLLDDILSQIPNNEPNLIKVRKYIQSKKNTIHEHI